MDLKIFMALLDWKIGALLAIFSILIWFWGSRAMVWIEPSGPPTLEFIKGTPLADNLKLFIWPAFFIWILATFVKGLMS